MQQYSLFSPELLSHTTDCMALYHPTHPSLPCTEPFPPPSPMEFHVKCGVHEELCELSGEARIGELRRVVRGVVAAHLSGVGDAFEMCLVPEGISLDDDESVAHLSAGSCVEVVVSIKAVAVQELAKRDIPLTWESVVKATRSKSYDVVGWLLQAGVIFHRPWRRASMYTSGQLCTDSLLPLQDPTVLNLIVDDDILLCKRALTCPAWRSESHVVTLVDAALARGSDRLKNHLLKALLSHVMEERWYMGIEDRTSQFLEEALPYCEALIPVSPLDGTVTILCGREDLKQFANLLSMLLEHGAAVDSDVLFELQQGIPLETLQLLVQKGADPNACLRKHRKHAYVQRRPYQELLNMEESLLACGMDIDTVCLDRNNTLLARAVEVADKPKYVTKLLSLGANPNVFDECGDTLTVLASPNLCWLNLQALLQSDRLDINQKSANGQTLLMYLAGKAALCHMGLVFEATTPDLEVEDTEGWTCLAHAASSRKVSAVKLLLKHGAKVDGGATTALEQAAVEGSLDVCEVLLDNGADPLHMTRGVKRKREEQGSEEEEEHSCRECGVTQTAAGVPFASESSVRQHVVAKHRMKWSDYLARYEE